MGDDGILRIVSNGTPSTAATIGETATAVQRLVPDVVPVLFDARDWPRPSSEVWMSIIDTAPTIANACAILIRPGGEAALGAFPAAVNRLMLPLEVFTDESEALAFLDQFVVPTGDVEDG
jgi:hypothetical protein